MDPLIFHFVKPYLRRRFLMWKLFNLNCFTDMYIPYILCMDVPWPYIQCLHTYEMEQIVLRWWICLLSTSLTKFTSSYYWLFIQLCYSKHKDLTINSTFPLLCKYFESNQSKERNKEQWNDCDFWRKLKANQGRK